jgi:chromosome segregation ATPase
LDALRRREADTLRALQVESERHSAAEAAQQKAYTDLCNNMDLQKTQNANLRAELDSMGTESAVRAAQLQHRLESELERAKEHEKLSGMQAVEAEQRLHSERARQHALEIELAAVQQKVEGMQAHMADDRHSLAELRLRNEELQIQLSRSSTEASFGRQQLERLMGDLDEERNVRAGREEEVHSLSQALHETSKRHEELQAEHDRLQRDFEARSAEYHSGLRSSSLQLEEVKRSNIAPPPTLATLA